MFGFKSNQAFTLMELLISIGIVAILASVAIPSYMSYTKKSHYSEVIQTGDRYKNSVAACFEITGSLSTCDANSYGIPPNITVATGQVASTSVENGVITITPNASHGIAASDTYILTPSISASGMTWAVSGGACDSALVTNCSGSTDDSGESEEGDAPGWWQAFLDWISQFF